MSDPITTPPDEAAIRSTFLATIDQWATAPFAADGLPGVPYRWDGKDETVGLDCSGCVCRAGEIAAIWPKGFALATNAAKLYYELDHVAEAALKPGDLAFYGPGAVDHVMAVVGDGRVVGSSGAGSNCTDLAIARGLGACVHYEPSPRYRRDLIGFARLPVLAVCE